MGIIGSIYKKSCLISPWVEVALRQLYWKNRSMFKTAAKEFHTAEITNKNSVDFQKVLDWLKANGVGEGSLLVVHSSYGVLESTGLEPNEIVEKLLGLVGKTGTLAMPAIRKFKGFPSTSERTGNEVIDVICKYDVRRTKVVSGALPYYMVLRKDSEVSRFPLNPMVAIGPLAKDMMAHNLEGDKPSPHGPNSAWKFCYDHNAIVVGLGASLEHYNTIVHVAEEAFGDWRWSDDEWYCDRTFDIIDGDFQRRIQVKERKPYIGKLHIAEINLYHDLIKNGIVKEGLIEESIPVYKENAKEFIDYLRSKNKKGYPYFGL